MAEENKLLSSEEIQQLKSKGYESRGLGFAKDNKFVSNKEIDDIVAQIRETSPFKLLQKRVDKVESDLLDVYEYVTDPKNDIERKILSSKGAEKEVLASLSSINNSIIGVGKSFKTLETIFAGLIANRKAEEYKTEETAQEKGVLKPTTRREQVRESGDSFSSLLKSFFLNPAVIAAFSGLVYLLLPKDVKEKINSFFSGFLKGLTDNTTELTGFQKALLASAAALGTFLGAKALEKIFDAVSTVVSLINKAKTTFGALRKKGLKGLAVGAAAVGGAAAAGVAIASAVGGEEKPEPEGKPSPAGSAPPPTPSPSAGGAAAGPAATPDTKPPVSGSAQPTLPPGSKEDPMNADLNAYVKKKDSGVDLEGLNPNLKKRLAGMAKEYNEKTGKKIQINSAFRDPKEQAELFAKIGPPNAAPPGRSKHEVGTAFDMNSGDAATAIQLGLFSKYGFTRPIAKETWHVEPVENRGGSFPDNPVSPGRPVIVASAVGAVDPGSGKKVPETFIKPKIAATAAAAPVADINELEPASTSLEPSSASKGTSVMSSSEDIESMGVGGGRGAVVNNTFDNSRQLAEKEGADAPLPIPSPVANRGSLSRGTKHSTAYA